ncbi:hypothetical protein SESBI_43967 [Sesbania bispinosa]|nr:hypothetical protein SESBI_43967 [Sesbania bispinosa]
MKKSFVWLDRNIGTICGKPLHLLTIPIIVFCCYFVTVSSEFRHGPTLFETIQQDVSLITYFLALTLILHSSATMVDTRSVATAGVGHGRPADAGIFDILEMFCRSQTSSSMTMSSAPAVSRWCMPISLPESSPMTANHVDHIPMLQHKEPLLETLHHRELKTRLNPNQKR